MKTKYINRHRVDDLIRIAAMRTVYKHVNPLHLTRNEGRVLMGGTSFVAKLAADGLNGKGPFKIEQGQIKSRDQGKSTT